MRHWMYTHLSEYLSCGVFGTSIIYRSGSGFLCSRTHGASEGAHLGRDSKHETRPKRDRSMRVHPIPSHSIPSHRMASRHPTPSCQSQGGGKTGRRVRSNVAGGRRSGARAPAAAATGVGRGRLRDDDGTNASVRRPRVQQPHVETDGGEHRQM